MDLFFKDLKVVELANVLAGPAVGSFFSELGAEVIKIENKRNGGDVTRSWKLASEDAQSSISNYYASVNWNKKSVFVDLTTTEDKQLIYNYIANADLVISNYKPGDDTKLGMDYDTLKTINPKVIYAHITGFGSHEKRTAYDLVLQAETGFMYMNGTQESGPLKMPVALIDVLAAHQLKEGILVALLKKAKTGEGSCIRVSLFDAAIASLANQAGNWLMSKANPSAMGSLHPNIAPYGELFETADNKKIVLAIGSDKQFEHLCSLLNSVELAQDVKFQTNPQRVKNRALLFDLLTSKFKKYTASVLMKEFIRNDIPAGLVKSLQEVFEEPKAKSLVLKETIEGKSTQKVKTVVFE